jgi:hypothetical protein
MMRAVYESGESKRMEEKIAELLGDAGDGRGGIAVDSVQILLMKLVHIATNEIELSSKRLEKLTARLIVLTWVLIGLTIVLAIFTAPLAVDAVRHLRR